MWIRWEFGCVIWKMWPVNLLTGWVKLWCHNEMSWGHTWILNHPVLRLTLNMIFSHVNIFRENKSLSLAPFRWKKPRRDPCDVTTFCYQVKQPSSTRMQGQSEKNLIRHIWYTSLYTWFYRIYESWDVDALKVAPCLLRSKNLELFLEYFHLHAVFIDFCSETPLLSTVYLFARSPNEDYDNFVKFVTTTMQAFGGSFHHSVVYNLLSYYWQRLKHIFWVNRIQDYQDDRGNNHKNAHVVILTVWNTLISHWNLRWFIHIHQTYQHLPVGVVLEPWRGCEKWHPDSHPFGTP